ncbi:MAG: MFS transporter [Prevotella sp.]|nr:MFS transporter [Prevotella sp.]
MNTQTPTVDIRLWKKSFWLMALSCFLLSVTVTMLIPALPRWLMLEQGLTTAETGIAMTAFAVGLVVPGGFCSFLVQRYRRNQVCMLSAAVLALSVVALLFVPVKGCWLAAAGLRFLQGASFGLSQLVLFSTLIVDTCESHRRTEANHASTWFGRFALSIGPLCALILTDVAGFDLTVWLSAACALLTGVLISMVHFPFRVPYESPHVFSFDRFILVTGWPMLLLLFAVSLAVGLLLSLPLDVPFYGLLMVGFLLALLAQRFIFPDAELKSEAVSGLLLVGASVLVRLSAPESPLFPSMLGFGIGILGARFVLFFVKLAPHCRRGTSLSTYAVGWETGLATGIGLGYICFANTPRDLLLVALAVVSACLLAYVLFLHRWFMTHKNR